MGAPIIGATRVRDNWFCVSLIPSPGWLRSTRVSNGNMCPFRSPRSTGGRSCMIAFEGRLSGQKLRGRKAFRLGADRAGRKPLPGIRSVFSPAAVAGFAGRVRRSRLIAIDASGSGPGGSRGP